MATPKEPSLGGVPLKYISLITLTVQNSLLTILLHYSRAYGTPYSASAAVLLNEVLKGSISFGVALYNTYHVASSAEEAENEKRAKAFEGMSSRVVVADLLARCKRLRKEIISPDCWKLSIPAILYVIQNNLQFVAASNLDVATFQVSYQMKILTTALFSVLLLKRRLTLPKWLSLLGLAIGVGVVQIQAGQASGAASQPVHAMDPTTGFAAVAAACFTSGLAGVYFEMVLKGSQADLWVRNVQLAGFSLIPALLASLFPDFRISSLVDWNAYMSAGDSVSWILTRSFGVSSPDWMFSGFGVWAWSVVLCQVFGGLVTALVIRYSDNIMKGFATSLSIVLSFVAGIILFSFQITASFVIGCSIVLASTYIYNMPQQPVPGSRPVSMSSAAYEKLPLDLTDSRRSSGSIALNFEDRNGVMEQRKPYDVSTPSANLERTPSFADLQSEAEQGYSLPRRADLR